MSILKSLRRIIVSLSLIAWAGCVGRPRAQVSQRWADLAAPARAAQLTQRAGTDLRYLAVPGARLRFIELSAPAHVSTRPTLFVHGLGGGLGDFAPVMLLALGSARLVAVDLPGSGGSTSQQHDYSVDGSVRALAVFIERLGLAPVRLACHSLGGQICLALALEHRELVHDLTLVAPAGIYRREDFIREATKRFGISTGQIGMRDPSRSFAALLTHGDDVVLRRFVAHDPQTIAALASFRENLRERLHELRVPSLVIWGNRDPVLPMADGFALAASAHDATLRIVEGAGHSPQLSHPEKIHAWMRESFRQ